MNFSLKTGLFYLGLLMALVGCGIVVQSKGDSNLNEKPASTSAPEKVISSKAAPVAKRSETPSQKPEKDLLDQALDKGMGAATIAQTAISRDDWDLVASQWKEAIALLKEVPKSSTNYETAQKKINLYQQNLAIAQQKIQKLNYEQKSLDITPAESEQKNAASAKQKLPNSATVLNSPKQQVSASAPQTTAQQQVVNQSLSKKEPVTSNKAEDSQQFSKLCQAVNPTGKSQSLELSNLQFYNDGFKVEEYLIGCITNHSKEIVKKVSVNYTYQSKDLNFHGWGFVPLNFVDDNGIQPGQSIAFKSKFTIERNPPKVELGSLYWCGKKDNICILGGSQSKTVPLSITVSR